MSQYSVEVGASYTDSIWLTNAQLDTLTTSIAHMWYIRFPEPMCSTGKQSVVLEFRWDFLVLSPILKANVPQDQEFHKLEEFSLNPL